ncbi:MAG: hypothetical protein OXC11_11555, partial [Rhodospirillales bacterium]|nr:hypothetical protein [Rhodospirillales bacterium]
SVNTADDAVATSPAPTPIPGHQARSWTFVKDADIGASVAHGVVSWDPADPADFRRDGGPLTSPAAHDPIGHLAKRPSMVEASWR